MSYVLCPTCCALCPQYRASRSCCSMSALLMFLAAYLTPLAAFPTFPTAFLTHLVGSMTYLAAFLTYLAVCAGQRAALPPQSRQAAGRKTGAINGDSVCRGTNVYGDQRELSVLVREGGRVPGQPPRVCPGLAVAPTLSSYALFVLCSYALFFPGVLGALFMPPSLRTPCRMGIFGHGCQSVRSDGGDARMGRKDNSHLHH
eukprot:1964949-Rhodomonas_salina.2